MKGDNRNQLLHMDTPRYGMVHVHRVYIKNIKSKFTLRCLVDKMVEIKSLDFIRRIKSCKSKKTFFLFNLIIIIIITLLTL